VSALPGDVDATRRRQLRAILHGRAIAYVLTIGFVATALAGAYLHSLAVPVIGTAALAAAVALRSLVLAARRSTEDFFAAYASARGFTQIGRIELLPLTPLLGAGDRRHCDHYMEGALPGSAARGLRCGLGHYTFYVPRDDHGSGAGRESHDFTISVVDLEPGISLFPAIFLARRRGLFGFLDGEQWLSHANRHHVELESLELCERYELWVDEDQDELLLRELFAPSFVVWLAAHPLAPCFEYRAGTLVVYLERKLTDEGHLDWLLEATAEVAGRFAREIEERTRVLSAGKAAVQG
jgi:hypothetical protein